MPNTRELRQYLVMFFFTLLLWNSDPQCLAPKPKLDLENPNELYDPEVMLASAGCKKRESHRDTADVTKEVTNVVSSEEVEQVEESVEQVVEEVKDEVTELAVHRLRQIIGMIPHYFTKHFYDYSVSSDDRITKRLSKLRSGNVPSKLARRLARRFVNTLVDRNQHYFEGCGNTEEMIKYLKDIIQHHIMNTPLMDIPVCQSSSGDTIESSEQPMGTDEGDVSPGKDVDRES
ncbi:uncharacterized protein BXIN_0737 [Babesia sp. Xinjiang]|uniref:uncharacterized protein n=1 Tax=Babesia sp. Xinjiang TaxID=462227 RepID=UPI000A2257EC|nr:uncharacterized protein BXIN_0737 [Babesia sp. Xinjiang]ORM41380.1 hypothetical protein BXIN_0737 [Babesia sp. Xinjiang]